MKGFPQCWFRITISWHTHKPLNTVQHYFSATMGQEFDAWLKEAVINGRCQNVNDYKEKAPHGTFSHPWPDQDVNDHCHRSAFDPLPTNFTWKGGHFNPFAYERVFSGYVLP
ncbi:hypothetical protein Tco_0598679 [Tanacetum coccineum]